MISHEIKANIILLAQRERWSQRAIAKELGLSRDVIQRVLRKHFNNEKGQPRETMIDPFIPFIKATLEQFPQLTGSRLFQMVVERGYQGKVDHFRDLLRPLRPEKKQEAFMRLVSLPGEQGQVDWGSFGKIKVGNSTRKLYAFVMVLSWSRQIFLKFYLSMDTSFFLEGHKEAFIFFKGVPRVILHDNLKSAVTERNQNLVRFNKLYLEFASHYKFCPRACNIRRGNEKGKVERAIRYTRDNFFAGRNFKDLEDINKQSMDWCANISGQRRCIGEPLLSVAEAFLREQSFLLNLPSDHFSTKIRHLAKAGKTHYVRFDGNHYSIPGDYVRKLIGIEADHDTVNLYFNEKLIATHKRFWDKGEYHILEHHVTEIAERKKRILYPHNLHSLLTLLPSSQGFLEKVILGSGSQGHAVSELHSCLNEYGIELVEDGIKEILNKDRCSVPELKIIIEKMRYKKGKNTVVHLSKSSEEKIKNLTPISTDLAKYDNLGRQ